MPSFWQSLTELLLDRTLSKSSKTLTRRSVGRTYSRVARSVNGVRKDQGLIAEVVPRNRTLYLSDYRESRGNGMRGLQLQVRRMQLLSQDSTVEIRPWLGRPWTLKAPRRSHRCWPLRQSRQVNRGQTPGNRMSSLSKSRQLQLQIIMQRLRS